MVLEVYFDAWTSNGAWRLVASYPSQASLQQAVNLATMSALNQTLNSLSANVLKCAVDKSPQCKFKCIHSSYSNTIISLFTKGLAPKRNGIFDRPYKLALDKSFPLMVSPFLGLTSDIMICRHFT